MDKDSGKQKKTKSPSKAAPLLELIDKFGEDTQLSIELINRGAFYKGMKVDEWQLISELGYGAGSVVWSATSTKPKASKTPIALKICVSKLEPKIESFNNEIKTAKKIKKIKGILHPIRTKPYKDEKNKAWIALPLAKPAKEMVLSANPFFLISCLKHSIDTLNELKQQNAFYGDLKLDNIMVYNNQFHFIDLGAIKFELTQHLENHEYTTLGKELIFKDLTSIIRHVDQNRPSQVTQALLACKSIEQIEAIITPYLAAHLQYLAANELRQNNKNKQALKCIEKGLNLCPFHRDLVLLKAQIYFSQSDPMEAFSLLHTYLAHNKTDDDILQMMAFISNNLGHYSIAEKHCKQATHYNPKNLSALALLGELNQRKKVLNYFKQSTEKMNRFDKTTINHKSPVLHELSSAFKENPKLIGCSENKVLFEGKGVPKNSPLANIEMSWDQYFTDLSYASYRSVYDGERRPFRQRTWHYTFKNLSLLKDIFATNQKQIKILDIGCSSGYLRRFLEGNYSQHDTQQLLYWGLDSRKEVLATAVYGDNFIESGAPGTKVPSAFIAQNVQHGLPFKDGFFDIVVNFEMIKYLPIPLGERLLLEIFRVLRPEGKLYLSTTSSSGNEGDIGALSNTEFKKRLKKSGFKQITVTGGVTTFDTLFAKLTKEEKKVAEKLLTYHPPEIVCAILTPLYPNIASQVMYKAEK